MIPRQPPEAGQPLSAREREVLVLAAYGLGNGQIAARLWVSVNTVKKHLSRCYLKLEVHGRAGAVGAALRSGQIE